MWLCRCKMPDGTTELTFWLTQDGADQMESETEQAYPGAWCEVEPVEDEPPGERSSLVEGLDPASTYGL